MGPPAPAGGVVGRFGLPAGPDDAEPGAGEDADGVRVLRGCLVGAFGAVEQRAHFGDELTKADRAHARQRFEQLRLGMLVEACCDRGVEVGDRPKQGAQEPCLREHEFGDDLLIERVDGLRRLAERGEQLAGAAPAAVGVAAQEGSESSLAQPRRALRGRVALEEVERDLAVEPSEDRRGARPVLSEQHRELVGCRDARLHVVIPQAHQRLPSRPLSRVLR